ncbi:MULTISPECIES: MFS transporter [Microbacterium]|uniref:MFS transporter n=1 Tax=Microbacterium TaxID=33882 RepID=UPI002782DB6E|nr:MULTISPECIES: MFS transporter [Microbacterium]MDQ1085083.1 MFS family permease [Microbacterium sp. SORGH_AS_0344]MDQ1169641.1 MFS family permease [Microbacterium proteolyticum]
MPDQPPTASEPVPPVTRDIALSPRHRWRAYWVAVAVAALTILDLTKVNVALPSIEAALNAGPTELQLVVSGYILTFGLVLVPAGRLGDLRSRRVLFLVGLSLFLVTSLACALAPDTTVLLVARLLQGVAAGIQMPQVLGLVQQLFQGKERGRAFGLFGATIGIATAFGPTLGGLLIALGGSSDGWRLIFWINIPLVAVVIVLAAWLLPDTRTRSQRRLDLDPVGVALFALTILALMWPFLFTTGSPDDDPNRWWLLVASVIFAAAFVFWERRYAARGRMPLMPFTIFSLPSYRNGVLISTAYFSAIPAMFLLGTLFLQGGLGLEPVFAGMVTIGFAVASAWSSWIGGNLVMKLGRPLVVWGILGMVATAGALVLVALFTAPEWTPWMMAAVMAFGGFAGGLVISPNQTLTLADIPVRSGGVAGSVGQLGQRIGTAVGTAVALALFYATVYREQGTVDDTVVLYHDAYATGMIAVGVFLSLALLAGVADLAKRAKAGSQTP